MQIGEPTKSSRCDSNGCIEFLALPDGLVEISDTQWQSASNPEAGAGSTLQVDRLALKGLVQYARSSG